MQHKNKLVLVLIFTLGVLASTSHAMQIKKIKIEQKKESLGLPRELISIVFDYVNLKYLLHLNVKRENNFVTNLLAKENWEDTIFRYFVFVPKDSTRTIFIGPSIFRPALDGKCNKNNKRYYESLKEYLPKKLLKKAKKKFPLKEKLINTHKIILDFGAYRPAIGLHEPMIKLTNLKFQEIIELCKGKVIWLQVTHCWGNTHQSLDIVSKQKLLTNLETLKISSYPKNIQIIIETIKVIKNFKNLSNLEIRILLIDYYYVPPKFEHNEQLHLSFRELYEELKKLKSISIIKPYAPYGYALDWNKLLSNFPTNLRSLTLENKTVLSDENIKECIPRFEELEKLVLTGCMNLTKGIIPILKLLPKLKDVVYPSHFELTPN